MQNIIADNVPGRPRLHSFHFHVVLCVLSQWLDEVTFGVIGGVIATNV